MNVAILISGRGSNMRALVEHSFRDQSFFNVSVVVSNNPQSEGIQWAKEKGLSTETLFTSTPLGRLSDAEDRNLINLLDSYSIDLVCLAGFFKLVSSSFLQVFSDRVINIHPSLLPAFKGIKAPLQALDYGVKKAGCTVHFVSEDMDGGAIIDQRVVSVFDEDTEESLSARILEQEHDLYSKVVDQFAQGFVHKKGRIVHILSS